MTLCVDRSFKDMSRISYKFFYLVVIAALSFFARACLANDWQLAWSDEFNYVGHPDPEKWGYEGGFNRNEEAQWYTGDKLENARVENGYLILEARKDHIVNPNYQAGAQSWRQNRPFAAYSSASLMTKGKIAWKYGRIEIKAKLPQGRGLWPAIWMLGENIDEVRYPRCGEIDIMEYYGKKPGYVFGNLHFNNDGKRASFPGVANISQSISDFHVYAIEWDDEKIKFFVDQNNYLTFPLSSADTPDGNPFKKKQYLLMNLALGGSSGGAIDDSALPARFLVDYVRVYQRK